MIAEPRRRSEWKHLLRRRWLFREPGRDFTDREVEFVGSVSGTHLPQLPVMPFAF